MSNRTININDNELKNIVKKYLNEAYEENVDEGFFDTIKQPFQKLKYGIKGMMGGQGWSYMSYMVELKNILKDMVSTEDENEDEIKRLVKLREKIKESSMRSDLKKDITDAILELVSYRNLYKKSINNLLKKTYITLKKGKPIDINRQPKTRKKPTTSSIPSSLSTSLSSVLQNPTPNPSPSTSSSPNPSTSSSSSPNPSTSSSPTPNPSPSTSPTPNPSRKRRKPQTNP